MFPHPSSSLRIYKDSFAKWWPYRFLLSNCVDVQPRTEEWGQDSYAFVPAPQIVLQCIRWHSHLTGIAFQSVPYDWILCFLPICGNGALFPSSQAYFHLNDLFISLGHLTTPHPPLRSACWRYCFTHYSFRSNCCLWYISIRDCVAAVRSGDLSQRMTLRLFLCGSFSGSCPSGQAICFKKWEEIGWDTTYLNIRMLVLWFLLLTCAPSLEDWKLARI